MAPHHTESVNSRNSVVTTVPKIAPTRARIRRQIDEEGGTTTAKYPQYLPTWDYGEKYPPLEPFTHIERGRGADGTFKDLLPPGNTFSKLTPTIGLEVTGVQLSQLTSVAKDQLALLVAREKVVVFRDQDFADLPLQAALDWGGYFGRHHIHPTSGAPAGYPEFHLVHRLGVNSEEDRVFSGRTSSVAWHSDVSYEAQPPGTTFLTLLESPGVGGDTAFIDQVDAYNRLSPAFKERLHGLKAVHSAIEQAEFSKEQGGVVRRAPVTNEHPVVRTHPATGEKALFVNPEFTRSIVGFKKEESEALLQFLYNHISSGIDFQVRVRWAPKTVLVWDNRVLAHSAIVDWTTGERRHLARITPLAERPFETPYVQS